jgi:transcriptional regulator with XRE-family HTH domain
MELKTFGQRIKELRAERGWTQQYLAYKAGLSQQDITQVERRDAKPHPATVRRLAEAFGIKPKTLLIGTPYKYKAPITARVEVREAIYEKETA